MIHVTNAGSITTTRFPSVSLNVSIIYKYFYFFGGGRHNIINILQVMKPVHMAK